MSNSLLVEPSEIATGNGRSLTLSVIATASVVVVPTFTAFALLVFSQPDPYVAAAVIASVVLTAGTAVAGAALWARQPESAGIPFGDLMLWSWFRHRHADRTLVQAAAVLGYDRMGRRIGEPTASREESLSAMLAIGRALDAKSSYTLSHSRRVARHARRMAAELDLSSGDADALELAASLHDVGNIGLPDAILRKSGELSIDERSAVEAHVLLGALIMEQAGAKQVVNGIRHHHEHWKGDGYPDGLSGLQIPLFARVIAIAEAFDAMTSTRPYRQGFGTHEAVTILRSGAGTQFDPDLVETFISTLGETRPFAKAAPFLGRFQGYLRELWFVFKRIGAVAISAMASTIAIALILGSTVLSPGVPPDEARLDVARRGGSPDPDDRVLGSRVSTDEDESDPSDPVETSASAVGEDSTSVDTTDGPAALEDRRRSGAVNGDPITLDPGSPSKDPGTEPPSDGSGAPEPQPEPEPEPQPTETTEPPANEPPAEEPSDADEKDKNPDANGNGHAHGQDKDKGGKP